MDGFSIISFSKTGNMTLPWRVSGIADFDGDGKADILWSDPSGIRAIWLMNGQVVSDYEFLSGNANTSVIAGTGDFNGDGKADILLRDFAGNVTALLMDGTTITSSNSLGNVSDRQAQ